jgi:hypothetical protein
VLFSLDRGFFFFLSSDEHEKKRELPLLMGENVGIAVTIA